MSAPTIDATLEITSSRRLNFGVGETFTLRDNNITIELKMTRQHQDGDTWIITGKVTNVWPAKSQN